MKKSEASRIIALLGKGFEIWLASRERRHRTVYIKVFVYSLKLFSKRIWMNI